MNKQLAARQWQGKKKGWEGGRGFCDSFVNHLQIFRNFHKIKNQKRQQSSMNTDGYKTLRNVHAKP